MPFTLDKDGKPITSADYFLKKEIKTPPKKVEKPKKLGKKTKK